jgi:transcriptional regulator with PAS, ATPase and Fis domain
MINIVFVVPYPEMEESVREVFNTHPQKEILDQSISVIAAEKLNVDELDGDIVISRGLTFQKIKKYKPQMPKIELSIKALDIIESLRRCIEKYNPKKIALISHYNSLVDAKGFFNLLNCDIEVYDQVSVENIPTIFELALRNGCDTFVGGYSVCRHAVEQNKNCFVIQTGREAIANALDEAIRTYEILKNNEIAKNIIEHSKDGIIHLGKDFKVTLMNTEAQYYLKKLTLKEEFYQKHIKDLFPFMYNNVKQVFLEKKEITNELYGSLDVLVSTTYSPIFIGDDVSGVIINFTSVEKIQDDEIQIRKKLSEKGLKAKYTFENIAYKSELMRRTIEMAEKVALVSSNVLIFGETGTGKELFAQSIHNASTRKNGPFVAVNCASLPESLIESELFGYTEGSFTGSAKGGKKGLIELAHNGTLFLDEISELPMSFQSKLLRVLQEHEVRRVGDDKMISVDIRIIAALNKNIHQLVKDGLFRKDLLYRLDILRLHIPPLRSRPEDILELFMHFVNRYNKKLGRNIGSISPQAGKLLANYAFEGNVRELKNIVERICVLNSSNTVDYNDIYNALYYKDADGDHHLDINPGILRVAEETSEKQVIEQTLIKTEFNQKKAAELLGIDRTTLWRKIKKFKIEI